MAQQPVNLNTKDTFLLLRKIASYLAANGVGTLAADGADAAGTDIFMQVLPEAPITGTVIVSTGGIDLPSDPTRRPGFQVLHRNPNASLGLAKSVQINRLLAGQWNVLSGFPGRITAVSEPGSYFKDDAGNFQYFLNYVVTSTFQR